MAASDVVISHLQSARRELDEQRADLDRMIADLDRLLEHYGKAGASGGGTSDVETTPAHGTRIPVMRDAIMHTITSEDRDFATHEIVDHLTRRYGWNKASIRSLLVRMAKDGLIFNVQRGYYNARAPKNAEGSAVVAAEPSDLPDQAGQEVIPDGNPAHRDLGPSSAGWLDRDHDHGASVAG